MFRTQRFCLSIANKSMVKHTVIRNFGILDNVVGYAGKKMEKKRDAAFIEMIDLMMSSKTWNLRHVKGTLEKQLSSWTMYVPGVKGAEQTKQVQTFKDVLDKMSDDELDHPEKINGPIRDRIAGTAGVNVDEVSKLLMAYKQGMITQRWLQMKKRRNETLPVNEAEMTAMQENDMRIQQIVRDVMVPNKKARPSGRGRRSPF